MQFVSGVFHPLLLSTYVMVLFFLYQPSFFSPVSVDQVPKLILAAAVTTFVIPVLSIVIMKLTSRISSLSLSLREERMMPFLSILLFYVATTYLFTTRIGITGPVKVMMISMTGLIGVLFLITFWEKISIHAAASWALVGLLCGVSYKYTGLLFMYPLIASVLLAGLVSSARLYLNRHTPFQVWSGAMLGFSTALIALLLFG